MNQTETVIKFDAIPSNLGIFVAHPKPQWGGRSIPVLFRFNGEVGAATYAKEWLLVKNATSIETVESWAKGAIINRRFELIDISIASEAIPAIIDATEVCPAGYGDWAARATLRPLYRLAFDNEPDFWKPEPFSINMLAPIQIDRFNEPFDMTVTVRKDVDWGNKEGRDTKLSEVTRWSELETILTPEFLLPERPCSISSQQTFEIVRKWVEDHIDPVQAVITSDYRFCFTVKKKIAVKPWENKWEVKTQRGKSYHPPKFSAKTVTYKEVEVFEMTHAGEAYKGYTIINGFSGSSLRELADNIRVYLDDLTSYINLPVAECPTCAGTGHVFPAKFIINERRT